MRAWVAFSLAVVCCGCTVHRRFELPAESRTMVRGVAPPKDLAWYLGEVHVRAAPQPMVLTDYEEARTQLGDRLALTLSSQRELGHKVLRREDAEVLLDVDVEVAEQQSVNGWLAGAIGVEVATLAAGTAAGYGLDRARGGAGDDGAVAGALVSVVPAILLPLLVPAASHQGTMEATLTVRRASDGEAIMLRHAHVEWRDDVNAYFVESKLARTSGEAVQQLEQRLVDSLARAFAELPPDLRKKPATQALAAGSGSD